jgi:hypothetical protein
VVFRLFVFVFFFIPFTFRWKFGSGIFSTKAWRIRRLVHRGSHNKQEGASLWNSLNISRLIYEVLSLANAQTPGTCLEVDSRR